MWDPVMKQRVVVTGVGVVAPNGIGKDAFWQALIQGLSGVRSIRRFDTSSFTSRIGGEINAFDPLPYFESKEIKKVDRSNLYAIAAGVMALEDSGLDLAHENTERIGSAIGNALGGVEFVDKEIDVMREKGPRWGSPYLAIAFFSCGTNGLLSIRLGLKGVVLTLCNGNTSGTDALGMAYRTIQSGRADVMFAGGTEAPLVPLFLGSLAKDGFLSQRNADPEKASRPFDLHADGMVLGEGAALLTLESLDHARARGARIYAEVVGYASGSSAFDVLRPEPNGKGLVSTMRRAMQEARWEPRDVDVVHSQGLSILDQDRMEARCSWETFGQASRRPLVTSVSSHIGNSLGALGGFQAAASVLMLERQTVTSMANMTDSAPEYPLRYAPAAAASAPVDTILQNAYCFMGKSSSLAFRRYAA
jgi:3-oxoacyl-[acyl-carrier-protein] synthase II